MRNPQKFKGLILDKDNPHMQAQLPASIVFLTDQQSFPEQNNQQTQKYFNFQNQHQELKVKSDASKDTKSFQPIKRSQNYLDNQNAQIHQLNQLSPAQRLQRLRQSPQRINNGIIPQVSLTKADEKVIIGKQIPAETPKFNQYYTLLGKQNLTKIARANENNQSDKVQNRISNQYVRSKSLQKNQIQSTSLITNQVTNIYNQNDGVQEDNQNINSDNLKYFDEKFDSINQEDMQKNNVNVRFLNNIKKNARLFMQSHSSLSQHNNEESQKIMAGQFMIDRISGSVETLDQTSNGLKQSFRKGKQVLKLKKSNIKFQQKNQQQNNQQDYKTQNISNNYYSNQSENQMNQRNKQSQELQSPAINSKIVKSKKLQIQSDKKQLIIERQTLLGYGGVMIGSPKMQQKQQEAKFYNESCVMSSNSSNLSIEEKEFEVEEEDEIKISYIKTEKQINHVQFSKEAPNEYQQFLNLQNEDDSFEIQFNRVRSIQQVRRSQDTSTAEQLKVIQSMYKQNLYIRAQVKHISDSNLNRIQDNSNNSLSTLQQIQLKREKELQLATKNEHMPNSAATTYRENYNVAKTRLDDKILQNNNIHFSNAKQEFLQISEAKITKQNLLQKGLIESYDKNFSKKIKFTKNNYKKDNSINNQKPAKLCTTIKDSTYEFIQLHDQQFHFAVPKASIISIQSNIANEGYPGQINNYGLNKIQSLAFLLKSQPYLLCQDEKIMFEIISLLSEQEMCRLSICFMNKKLVQIRHNFLSRWSVISLQQSQEQMMQVWRMKYLPRIITSDLSQYYTQISSFKSQYDFEIEKDVERTFPNEQYFSKSHSNQQKMKRILKAAAYHVPQVGYVQGFNFIVGALIKLQRNEEEVFWMFVNILSFKDIHQLYIDGMPLLKLMVFNLNCFIQNLLPEIELFLSKKNIMLECFTTQWIITLFSLEFELNFFRNFLNHLLQIGPQFIIQLSLALIDHISIDLLSLQDMEQAMDFLKEFQSLKRLPINEIFANAMKFTQVTPGRLAELAHIYKTSKYKKRVLFVKDQDHNVTYLKTLPNLPDDEQMTECNVDEDSENSVSEDEDGIISGNNYQKRQKVKKQIQKQINNSFYLNNVSSQIEVRPASGLESVKNNNKKVVELQVDKSEEKDQQISQNIGIYQDSCESKIDIKKEDYEYEYFTNESQDQTKATKMNKNIQSSNNILSGFSQINTIDQLDPTPILDIEKSKYSKNFIESKKTLENHNLQHIQKSQQQSQTEIQKELDSQYATIIKAPNYPVNFNGKKISQELLEQMSRRRFLHSPSVDNLRSSFKINQKSQSLVSIVMSPNSENLLESEHKIDQDKIYDRYEHQLRKLNGVDSRVNLIQQLQQEDEMNRIIDESHNISNIEEFYDNLEYDSVNEKFQNTQRYTSRKDHREDLSERETLKLSWTKSKPLHQQLYLQFEINKQGSHLNTPHFQQTNRSTTILQEKKINNPVNSFDYKKGNALISKNIKVSENQNPNTDYVKANINQNTHISQTLRKKTIITNLQNNTQSNEELRIVFEEGNKNIKITNNYQRFSATQKNPTKQIQKNEQRQNRILHNWSASHPNVRDSQEFENISINSNSNIEEVIKSMKQQSLNNQHQLLQQPRSSRLMNKVSLMSSQQFANNNAPLSSREEIKPTINSHRSMFAQTLNLGSLDVASSNDLEQFVTKQKQKQQIQGNSNLKFENQLNVPQTIHHQPSNSYGGKSTKSQISQQAVYTNQDKNRKLCSNKDLKQFLQPSQNQSTSNHNHYTKHSGILSPRTTAANKQSYQLLVHKGDNYFDEGDMNTTLMTPKDSFQVSNIQKHNQINLYNKNNNDNQGNNNNLKHGMINNNRQQVKSANHWLSSNKQARKVSQQI